MIEDMVIFGLIGAVLVVVLEKFMICSWAYIYRFL